MLGRGRCRRELRCVLIGAGHNSAGGALASGREGLDGRRSSSRREGGRRGEDARGNAAGLPPRLGGHEPVDVRRIGRSSRPMARELRRTGWHSSRWPIASPRVPRWQLVRGRRPIWRRPSRPHRAFSAKDAATWRSLARDFRRRRAAYLRLLGSPMPSVRLHISC